MNIDGKDVVVRTPIVFVGNNCYALEGFEMSKRSSLDNGVLSICVTRDVGRLGLIGLMIRALFGRLRNAKDFLVYEAQNLRIEMHQSKIKVATDGEVNEMKTPLEYRSRKLALNTVFPQNGSDKTKTPS
ncbi:MAG: hypothetical protein H7X80_01240 [bacterium]|nr:hypothetical protein [Candidatus Kapabacteria bacterium]